MLKNALFFLIFFYCLYTVNADSVKDLIRQAGTAKEYPNAELLVIFDSTDTKVMESGLSHVNSHVLYKILSTKGANELSTVKADYDPQTAYVEIKKVKIYRKNGQVEELSKEDSKDYPAPARMIYWGARQKMIETGRLEIGDAVEVFIYKKGFTYALLQDDDEKYIPPMKGHFYDIVEFWNKHPVQKKVYKVRVPDSKNIQFRFYNGEVDTSTTHENESISYTFTKRNLNPIKKEPHSVALSDIAPKLLISTSPDWESKSRWFYNVNEDFGSFESTEEIDNKVSEILEGATSESDSVARLTHWVADEIRYSGISMGDGEGFTLHKGEMTFTDRCGVCKDKAGMLITMLRAAGFESYPAMTMAGSRIDSIPADQFNHCVTIVKLSDQKYHLLDPTWVPFVRELWSSAEQQQNYLMGVPEGADLMITPVSDAINHYFRITGKSELFLDGSLEGEINITAEGQSDATIRRMFVGHFKEEWNASIEKELLKSAPLIQINKISYKDPYDYSKPVEIVVSFRIPDFAIVTDEELMFIPFVASHLFKPYNRHLSFSTDLEERTYPFKDRCSRKVDLSEKIEIPFNYKEILLPEPGSSSGSGADFEGGYIENGNELSLFEKASYKKRIYDPADWPSFKEAVALQNRFAEEYIIIKLK